LACFWTGDSTAHDINDHGQIVGETDTVLGRQAFLYVAGSMVLLDGLIDPALGWTVQEANGINELGQIAGTACKAGLCYAVRLDLASAVPEPTEAMLLAAGLLMIFLAQRARHRPGARSMTLQESLVNAVREWRTALMDLLASQVRVNSSVCTVDARQMG
jgi:probable HAF family extracellular repeat protein